VKEGGRKKGKKTSPAWNGNSSCFSWDEKKKKYRRIFQTTQTIQIRSSCDRITGANEQKEKKKKKGKNKKNKENQKGNNKTRKRKEPKKKKKNKKERKKRKKDATRGRKALSQKDEA